MLPPFTVVGINEEPVTNNMVSFVKEVQVSVGGMHAINISLSQGKTIKVKLRLFVDVLNYVVRKFTFESLCLTTNKF